MKVNLLNTGNYEIYRKQNPSDKSSGISVIVNNPQSKKESNKIIIEGELYNTSKVNAKKEINPQYHHNSPVAETDKAFNSVLEIIQNNPDAYRDVVSPDKWLMPAVAKPTSNNNENSIPDQYIVSVYSGNREQEAGGLKRLKAQKSLFDKYNHGNWRAPGMLVNLSF